MLRKILINSCLVVIALVGIGNHAFGQPPVSLTQFGTSLTEVIWEVSATPGGVYVGGYTDSTLPGQTNSGAADGFLRKYDANGSEIWTRQFGSSSSDVVQGVSAVSGAVYVAGYTNGTLPGQTSAGAYDVFVRKYDVNGAEQWTRQFGTTTDELAFGVIARGAGVYLVGYTNGALPGQNSQGGHDAFIRKYDSDGLEQWTRQFGSSGLDYIYGVTATLNSIYVAGYTNGTLPGQSSAGGYDAFLRKYDLDGTELWTRQFGSSGSDHNRSVSAAFGGIYVVGNTSGTLPGQVSSGVNDAFVRKYDADGAELWTRQFGTSVDDVVFGVSSFAGSIYVAGYTYGTLPGQTTAGTIDAFVRKYEGDGAEVWTQQFGSSSHDLAYSVSATFGGVYVAGYTTGSMPGYTHAGGYDAFLAITSAR